MVLCSSVSLNLWVTAFCQLGDIFSHYFFKYFFSALPNFSSPPGMQMTWTSHLFKNIPDPWVSVNFYFFQAIFRMSNFYCSISKVNWFFCLFHFKVLKKWPFILFLMYIQMANIPILKCRRWNLEQVMLVVSSLE